MENTSTEELTARLKRFVALFGQDWVLPEGPLNVDFRIAGNKGREGVKPFILLSLYIYETTVQRNRGVRGCGILEVRVGLQNI